MRNWLAKFTPTPWLFRKLVILAMLIAVGVSAFFLGRSQKASAMTPPGKQSFDGPVTPTSGSDQAHRVVAYLYGQPVSREELGEYLIARFGVERLIFMLNRKIVETEAAKLNIYVTDSEVSARFERDIKALGPTMTAKDFENGVLRRFNKSLYEWREDVIRPKLMMEKIVRPKVRAALTDADLHEGFETRYGPKVECRMIVFSKDDPRGAEKTISEVRKGREAFLEAAKHQAIPNLAANEGKVPAIHKFFGDPALEEAAFRLREGEISGQIQLKDGAYVVLLCEKRIPADTTKRFEEERAKLVVEMEELRLLQRIPEEFESMKKRADPRPVLVAGTERTAMLDRPASSSLVQESGVVPASSTVVVPPAPVPQEVKPLAVQAPQQPVGPVVIPQIATPPPSLAPQNSGAPPSLAPQTSVTTPSLLNPAAPTSLVPQGPSTPSAPTFGAPQPAKK